MLRMRYLISPQVSSGVSSTTETCFRNHPPWRSRCPVRQLSDYFVLLCLRLLVRRLRTGSSRRCGIRMRAPFAPASSRPKLSSDSEARSGFCDRSAGALSMRVRANDR
jgi:hypothetical protein